MKQYQIWILLAFVGIIAGVAVYTNFFNNASDSTPAGLPAGDE